MLTHRPLLSFLVLTIPQLRNIPVIITIKLAWIVASSSFWQENQNLGPSDPVQCPISHDFQLPFRFKIKRKPLVLNSSVSIQCDYYGLKVDVGVVVLTWMLMPKLLLESKHPIYCDFGILFICRPQSIKLRSSIRPQIYWWIIWNGGIVLLEGFMKKRDFWGQILGNAVKKFT